MPAQTKATLKIVYGTTTKFFDLAGPVAVKHQTLAGEILRQGGGDKNDFFGKPWIIPDLAGIGVAKAVLGVIPDSDLRAFEMLNIDRWPGMWCLGPLAQATTDQSSTRRVAGFVNVNTALYYFGNAVTTAALEQAATWTGSTATWATATVTSGYEALGAGYSGFPVAGACAIGGTATLLRTTPQVDTATSNSVRQLLFSSSYLEHSAAGDYTKCPCQANGNTAYGLIPIGAKVYTVYGGAAAGTYNLSSSTTASNPTTWAAEAGTAMQTGSVPRSVVGWVNGSGALQVTVCANDSIWQAVSGGTPAKIVDFTSDIQTNNGVNATVFNPQIGGTAGAFSFLIVPQGKRLWAFHWVGNGTTAQLAGEDILQSLPHGLPTYRQGLVTAVAASKNYVWFAIGGEDASHTAGIYKAQYDGKEWRCWGPVYDVATAQKQIRAMYVSSNNDATPRLHFAEDTTAGGTVTTQKFIANPDDDPRFVSGYLHTAATGKLVLPKNDRDLGAFSGPWRKIVVVGQGLSSSNKVTAVYAVADGAPIGGDGSWGSTLGAVTANLGSVNFAATPSGTGQSANAMQIRLDLVGVSNASPYIESINVYVKKMTVPKFYYEFPIDLELPSTARSSQGTIADLKTVLAQTVDLQVSWEKQSAVSMEPYTSTQGLTIIPPLDYQYGPEANGVKSNMIPVRAVLRLAEV